MDRDFSSFTNKYSLSKTLRFELKPIGKTAEMLKEHDIFQKDFERKEAYIKIKPFFDDFHRKFMKEALEGKSLSDLHKYAEIYKKYLRDRKNKNVEKEWKAERSKLMGQVVNFFNQKANEWKNEKFSNFFKKDTKSDKNEKCLDWLFGEKVFKVLEKLYTEQGKDIKDGLDIEDISFDYWKGFTGYFSKFFETRKNIYKDDGTSTAFATRVVNNLDKYLNNLDIWNNEIKNIIDVSEIEQSFDIKIEDIFDVEYYSKCMLQDGIDEYNTIVGGKTLDNGNKIRGINEFINEYKQVHKEEGKKIHYIKKLEKQILSEKDDKTFFIDEIESDEELRELFNRFYEFTKSKFETLESLLNNFFTSPEVYDITGIYISKEAYNTISYKWTNGNHNVWNESLFSTLKLAKIMKSQKVDDGEYKFPDFISLEHLRLSLENIEIKELFWKDRYYENDTIGLDDDSGIWNNFLKIFQYEFSCLFDEYKLAREKFEILLKDFNVNGDSKAIIKELADNSLHLYQMAKYFSLEKKREWNDEYSLDSEFYNHSEYGYKDIYYEDTYDEIVKPYNKVRNYLTRKPYSEDKWKLNFENSQLASGWDRNKEPSNLTIILRKDNEYYLGIMTKGNNTLFEDKNKEAFVKNLESGCYEKLIYQYFPGAYKMIPKCTTQRKDVRRHFAENDTDYVLSSDKFLSPITISKRIYDLSNLLYDKNNIDKVTTNEKEGVKQFQKEYLALSSNSKKYKEALVDWINFCKVFLEKYKSTTAFNYSNIKPTESYEYLDELYKDIDKGSYSTTFCKISDSYIKGMNDLGKLYLFKIYNKDFSKDSTGSKNLHTMYFENLFSDENVEAVYPIKLNGAAELFYREKSLNATEYKEKINSGKEIIRKKRYTDDKIFFHVSTTMNRADDNSRDFNSQINDLLANNQNINIIGIDRGEKHLLYYNVIDQQGNILDRGTLNNIGNRNYDKLLEEREKKRLEERQNWEQIENIKDLKRGYLSLVVRKIVDLAIEHNAIIAMEDLNFRFKQIRGGLREKSVYQQFEKALIDKLSFLVNKSEKDATKAGHVLKAYQLTAPFESFEKMGKQSGIIFYTQAAYTSRIDPLTGWRPNLYVKYTSIENARDILVKKFVSIKYNSNKDRFEFTYNIKDEKSGKKDEKLNKLQWMVCSNVERFRYNKKLNSNKGGYEHYPEKTEGDDKSLTDSLKELFKKYTLQYENGENILGQIKEDCKLDASFYKSLFFYFSLICQIRNTKQDSEGNENDFILSPVEPFFDSRRSKEFGRNLPENGDDNGAYNIARKGIIILNRISEFKRTDGEEQKGYPNLAISNIAWDNFAQQDM